MKNYKVLDLFSGAGGLSLGFKLAGFNIIGAIDFNLDAIKTHKKNFYNSLSIHTDITSISEGFIKENFKNVDVIIGGPPCQGFSNANKWQKLEDDPRNKLFFEFIKFVEVLKPRVVLIENVKGILTKNGGFARKSIVTILEKLGYKVSFSTLIASDYGVPQKRTRAFFVATLENVFKFENLIKSEKVYTVKDAISDLYLLEKNHNIKLKYSTNSLVSFLRDSKLITNHEPKYPNEEVINRIKLVPQGGNWKDVPASLWKKQRTNRHSSAYKRLDENSPSITIDTGHMKYFHPLFNRVPTVRESARLQSFPDSFVFEGSITSQYRQVGNAVPPLLSLAIANEIKKLLS